MSTETKPIPENIQDICREFAEIARKHDLRDFSLKFSPKFDQGWGGEVHCSWDWGRHGDSGNYLVIQSSFNVHTHVTKKIESL